MLKSGTIRVKRTHKLFLEQCRYFPKGRFDDGLDALEMGIRTSGEDRTVRMWIVGGDDNGLRRRFRMDLGDVPGFYNGLY